MSYKGDCLYLVIFAKEKHDMPLLTVDHCCTTVALAAAPSQEAEERRTRTSILSEGDRAELRYFRTHGGSELDPNNWVGQDVSAACVVLRLVLVCAVLIFCIRFTSFSIAIWQCAKASVQYQVYSKRIPGEYDSGIEGQRENSSIWLYNVIFVFL